jgi:hypothetical protein
LVGLRRPARLPHQAKPAALSLHHCNLYQDILGWQDPFYWHCVAMFRWTSHAQRGLATCILNHSDFSPCDHLAANKAIPLLIEGMPPPELIESAQDIQFFVVGQRIRRKNSHHETMLSYLARHNQANPRLVYRSKS